MSDKGKPVRGRLRRRPIHVVVPELPAGFKQPAKPPKPSTPRGRGSDNPVKRPPLAMPLHIYKDGKLIEVVETPQPPEPTKEEKIAAMLSEYGLTVDDLKNVIEDQASARLVTDNEGGLSTEK